MSWRWAAGRTKLEAGATRAAGWLVVMALGVVIAGEHWVVTPGHVRDGGRCSVPRTMPAFLQPAMPAAPPAPFLPGEWAPSSARVPLASQSQPGWRPHIGSGRSSDASGEPAAARSPSAAPRKVSHHLARLCLPSLHLFLARSRSLSPLSGSFTAQSVIN